MPDLVTHSLVSRILLFGKRKKYLLFFLIGAILPDLVSRIPALFFARCYRCSWFVSVMHTPVVLIFCVLLISMFFRKPKVIFTSLILGVFSHLFLDAFQQHLGGGYYWFFPFSFVALEFGWFWPETCLYFILPLTLLTLVVYALELYWQGRKVSIPSNLKKNQACPPK